jgi:hypothetical protein
MLGCSFSWQGQPWLCLFMAQLTRKRHHPVLLSIQDIRLKKVELHHSSPVLAGSRSRLRLRVIISNDAVAFFWDGANLTVRFIKGRLDRGLGT